MKVDRRWEVLHPLRQTMVHIYSSLSRQVDASIASRHGMILSILFMKSY